MRRYGNWAEKAAKIRAENARILLHAYHQRRVGVKYNRMLNNQGYCNWVSDWLMECSRHLPPWHLPPAWLHR